MTAIYKFKHFENTDMVMHGFSTRLGGVSKGAYSSLNLGITRGDNRDAVLKNYSIFCGKLGINIENLVFSAQTHTTNVKTVTASDRGNGILRANSFKDVDGLMTSDANTALVTFYADCVPLFFLDPKKRIIALAHAGWKGTVNGIGMVTVKKMQNEFTSNPADILAGIAPSIGPCCFETDEPVYSLFERKGLENCVCETGNEGKRNIDLWKANEELLKLSGVKAENIETMGICTKCSPDTFYSHRVMGEIRGSLAAVIQLKNL
jgi:hypothetical protein